MQMGFFLKKIFDSSKKKKNEKKTKKVNAEKKPRGTLSAGDLINIFVKDACLLE